MENNTYFSYIAHTGNVWLLLAEKIYIDKKSSVGILIHLNKTTRNSVWLSKQENILIKLKHWFAKKWHLDVSL